MSKAAAKTPEQRKAEAEALRQTLVNQADALRESGEWRRFLASAVPLRAFSIRNVMLILAQRDSATDVAGFRQWLARGRAVRKGEKSIKIMAPSTRKTGKTVVDANGAESDQKITVFRPVSVFDIAQTDPVDGHDETPQAAGEGTITATTDPVELWARVSAVLQGKGWNVQRVSPLMLGGAEGMTTPSTRQIEVDERLEDAHAVLVLLHEAGHALLDSDKDGREYAAHRGACEVSAESVAYIMGTLLGLDPADTSAVYCASWMQDMSADEIQATAADVLQAVRELTEALGLDQAATAA